MRPSSISSSEGTREISQPQSGWCPATKTIQVLAEHRTFPGSAVLSGQKIISVVCQMLRVWLISGSRFATQFAPVVTVLLFAVGATAQTTNIVSAAEIRGRQLAQKLLEQRPAESFTNTGVLQIRDAQGKRSEIPVKCEVIATSTNSNWESIYEAGTTNQRVMLVVLHGPDQPNEYFYRTNSAATVPLLTDIPVLGHLFRGHQLTGAGLMMPFAGSDFWIADLGLEFLHWPGQKILRGDTARGRLCKVLESTNPNPTNGYSRVDSWIDNETLGIVEAKAYGADGKLLKEFYPKDIKKVNGQWQVGRMDIDNVQTGSRTRLELDGKK
jgi:Outer membrane lipoprotein-sorting protein